MRRVLRAVSLGLLACGVTAAAYAGPLEDGITAFDDQRFEQAQELFQRSAEDSSVRGQLLLGITYLRLPKSTENTQQAIAWLTKASSQGSAEAAFYLGILYSDAQLGFKDQEKSLKFLLLAAERGHANAALQAGLRYELGRGVKHNERRSLELFSTAAEAGSVDAQLLLGQRYLAGAGVEQEITTAVKWLTLAAENGSLEAKVTLKSMAADLQTGRRQVSFDFFREAKTLADRGESDAQYFVGLMYLAGENVGQDVGLGIQWITKAADQSYPDAIRKLIELYSSTEYGRQDLEKAASCRKKLQKLSK